VTRNGGNGREIFQLISTILNEVCKWLGVAVTVA